MFFSVLFLVSVLPYVVFPILFAGTSLPNTEQTRQAILFLGNAHIAITAYFYFDGHFREIIRANPMRYLAAPAAAVVGSSVSYALTPAPYVFVWWVVYTLWQNWHFGRQTFGVYAIATIDQTPGVSVSRFERALIYGTVVLGSAGAIFFVVRGAGKWDELALGLRTLCGIGTGALVVAGLCYIAANRTRFNVNRGLFFLFSLLFFAPQYLNPNVAVGFTVYSMSHSFQYLLFMAILAFNAGEVAWRPGLQLPPGLSVLLLFAVVAIGGGVIIGIRGEFGTMLTTATGSEMLGKLVSGAMFGLVVAHFVIDADAWKLRKRPQREFVMGRFNFLGHDVVRAAATEAREMNAI